VKKFSPGVLTAEKCGRDTVNEARDESKTVIASPLRPQSKSTFPQCDDCWGLVIVPNVDRQRQYAFEKAKVKSGVLIPGKRLTWKAAMWANLYIRIASDGKVHVKKFERCGHCQ
jgi:hypothetical protein